MASWEVFGTLYVLLYVLCTLGSGTGVSLVIVWVGYVMLTCFGLYSTSQSAGKDLDHETAAKMLKPILLLLAAYEAAQMYSITTDGEVLNGEITAHAWGHDYGFARTLRRYDDSLVRAEDQFSMTLDRVVCAMGRSHNKWDFPHLIVIWLTDVLQVDLHYGHGCVN